MTLIKRLLGRAVCFFSDHKRVSDGTWGGYGWTCPRCGKNDFAIHDM